MTGPQQMLSECIGIRPRFLRSVNLQKDCAVDTQNDGYIVTPTGRQILHRLAEGLTDNSPYRAWTVTGPYGVGKSAFAVFVTQLLCAQGASAKDALRKLEGIDPKCAHQISKLSTGSHGRDRMFPVLLTARRVPASMCLLEGIVEAAKHIKSQAAAATATKATALLRAAVRGAIPDSRAIVDCIAALAGAAQRRGHAGMLILVDELGKLFEYAAHNPQRGDVFVLQELAEYASRTNGFPVMLLGFLHQSFEEYGRHLDSVSRTEWAKIQGRFEDVAFLEPPEQVLRMIATAIRWKPDTMPSELRGRAKDLAKHAVACGVCPSGMRRDDFIETCLRAYPLHPSALVALPYLFHRFAQNERSLFSYLSSHEPKGFQDFLRAAPLNSRTPSFIRLADLFDYFTANFGSGLFRQPHARRWLEAADILETKGSLGGLHANLVKTIGILNALGAFCHLSGTQSMVSFAAADSLSSSEVERGLKDLTQRSILTYRKFNETYRIWEGSDVDIEERISEGQRRTRAGLSLAATIQRYLPARPIVARRHSFETGALRYFDVRYIDDPAEISRQSLTSTQASGSIFLCLSQSISHLDEFKQHARKMEAATVNLLYAIPQEIGEIRSTISELAAMQWAWENTPELRDDRIARRELAMRIADVQQLLMKNLARLLDPRDEPVGSRCVWYYRGSEQEARTPTDVTHLLSRVCDEIYSDSPRIRNELIVRRTLSSAAAAARRNLIERMLTCADKENLGLDGYPPERSMYESVLKATGLHHRNADGSWCFAEPARKDPCNLRPVWNKLSEIVFKAQPSPEPLDVLFRATSEPPLGVPDGLHAVLLCAFLCVHSDEVTLYRDDTFVPEPGITEFEVLMRRPELFAIAGCRITGGRLTVVQRIAKGLQVKPATIPVVRSLFRMVKGIPEFARSTTKLSGRTLALRKAFINATSPERFLFVELPEALGLEPIGEGKVQEESTERFFSAMNESLQEWSQATAVTIDRARDVLLQECGLPTGMEGWQLLRNGAHRLEPGVTHPTLLPFVRRIVQATMDQAGIESVLALVANRPPQMWTDTDVERFPASARVMGHIFKEADSAIHFSQSDVAFKSLRPTERKQAELLVHDIKRYLAGRKIDPRIVRAAITIALEHVEKR